MTPAPPELEDGVEYLEGWVVVVETRKIFGFLRSYNDEEDYNTDKQILPDCLETILIRSLSGDTSNQ